MAPDRGRSERDDPRACNPLTRRVGAEVIKRQTHSVNAAASIENEKEVVVCDKNAVFKLKEEQRMKWLQKALKQAGQGIVTPGEVYDVVSSTRFAENLNTPKVGRKMGLMLKDGLKLFTAKQQKFIMEKAVIVTRYVTDMPSMDDRAVPVAKSKKDKKDKKSKKDKDEDDGAVEDMMARIRGFVRDKQAEDRKDDDKKGGNKKGKRSRSRSGGSRSRSRRKDKEKERKRSASQSSRDKDREKGKRGRGGSRSRSQNSGRSRSGKKNTRRSPSIKRKTSDAKRKRSASRSSSSHRKDNKGRSKRGRASASKSRSRSRSPRRGKDDKKPDEKKEKQPEEKKDKADEKNEKPEDKKDKTDEKKRRKRSSSSSRS